MVVPLGHLIEGALEVKGVAFSLGCIPSYTAVCIKSQSTTVDRMSVLYSRPVYAVACGV
jgi:hypothetical protein